MTDVRKKNRLKQRRRRRAHLRVRRKVAGTAERPRLSVFKSLRYVYAQLIDDGAHRTLTAANSREAAVRERLSKGSLAGRTAARAVGELLAERAREMGVEAVVFDRGGYVYHGKVRDIAEGAREKGLRF